MWGSELKFFFGFSKTRFHCLPLCEVVSWNLKRDFNKWRASSLPLCEVVSWNTSAKSVALAKASLPLCEVVSWNIMKYFDHFFYCRLPLCEVVSWNDDTLHPKRDWYQSTSVWGSELKCTYGYLSPITHVSTSVWGSELKLQPHRQISLQVFVYLCVR